MNRKPRTLLVALALFGAVLAAPGVAAAEGGKDDDGEDKRGEKICERVLGLKACVAVLHGNCVLWVSAGTGGCIVPKFAGGGSGENVNSA